MVTTVIYFIPETEILDKRTCLLANGISEFKITLITNLEQRYWQQISILFVAKTFMYMMSNSKLKSAKSCLLL